MLGNETPTNGTVDTLLQRNVVAHPDRCALRSQGQSWTYTELDRRIGRLAGALRERGVGPGTRVGLLLSRSAECVALILAILRRGAAYVPLDPGHPARRLAYVRRHSGVHLLVTAGGHTAPAGPGEDVALADLLLEAEASTTDAPSSSNATPDGTAHILYTSGSTGTPKGVQLSQRAVANNVRACVRTFGLRPDDTLVLKTPLTFDVSAYEMFSTLAAGACLVVAPPGAEGDPDLLAATVDNYRVTVLHTVPAQLRALTETGAFVRNTSLRAVMSTGEKLPVALQRAFHCVRREPLYNFYGPTETAYATAYRAVPENAAIWADQATVPIGRPLDNVRCYVLDDAGRPVPDGQTGELHIGGESLADGYLDDDERTRERFHHVDLGGERTDRVYRTGDLVRRLPGGDLLYLGRADDQIKIAGQRIELGEVESAILGVPGVRAVAVTVRERDLDGAPELSAFVESDPTDHRTTTDLRTALAAWLPGRMVPAHLVPVARIPLLSNGKTDRLALARLHPSAPAPRSPGGQPVTPLRQDTPVAELVRRCFTEALGGPPPTDDSHFLHEGGDSLLAMRVVARLRRAGVPVSVADFLSHPVLADLVAYLGRSPARPVLPETGGTRPATAPTAAAPAHEWFTERVRTDRTYWNMFVRLRVLRPLAPAHLEAALRALVAAHPALRTRFVDDGTGVRMVPADGITSDRLVRTLDVTGTAERDTAVDRLHRSLDPSTGDHLRALLVHDREGDTTYLVVAIHHLVVDIVSWHVLLDDLVVALDALESGEEPSLPAQAETFQGWVEALPALGAELHEAAYWLSVLRLRRAAPSLAARGPARPEQAGGLLTFRVPAATTRQLLGPAPARLDMCVHDVMAAAVGLALARWRPDGAVTFDLETHGRHRWPQLDRLIGWFTAVFPVAWPSAPTTDLATELALARAALAAVPHGGTGYGVLRRHGGDPRTAAALRATPPALVCFNYLGRGDLGPPGGRFRTDGTPVPWEARSPRAERPYPVEVSAVVLDDQLAVWLSWAPSPADGLDESSVRRLRTHLRTVLDKLVLACPAEAVSAPSPAHRQPGLHR
ncbi:non-ribosomal peptide synthetase [Micromonospora sp. KC213]|uniref:non-ribosomal peptide synthetase n=1 Tax=Micromonospora sp. KC213 TaxID=2530378 RepID=UPI001404884C|nr:non-ribosomal peptide synthetase [Micromonospora sp. KC213]